MQPVTECLRVGMETSTRLSIFGAKLWIKAGEGLGDSGREDPVRRMDVTVIAGARILQAKQWMCKTWAVYTSDSERDDDWDDKPPRQTAQAISVKHTASQIRLRSWH